MVEEIDIYRSAKLLMDQHGELAELEAAMKADAMTAAGDIAGRRVWSRILDAIKSMQTVLPGDVKN